MAKFKKETPLRVGPRRRAGASGKSMLDEVMFDSFVAPLVMTATGLVLWGWEAFRFYSDSRPNPLLMGLFCVPLSLFCGWKAVKAVGKARNIKLGLDGEQRVADVLEELPRDSFRVFHDLVPDAKIGNIDHVVIGPAGLFVIETKTVRKIPGREPKIEHTASGEILIAGQPSMGDPLGQVDRVSKWAQREVKRLTNLEVPVQAVLVYPGWQIGPRPTRRSAWVVNDMMLVGAIQNQQPCLSVAEIQLVASHLERSSREGA